MIIYESAKLHPGLLFQRSGSVMPFSVAVALPCALISAGLKKASEFTYPGDQWGVLGLDKGTDQVASAAFTGLNFLIGFLVVFRAQQAYSRFWEGCSKIQAMQGEWWDAASSLCAFGRQATAKKIDIVSFQHTLVRLLSLLHSAVLMELCAGFDRNDPGVLSGERAFELELIDAEGIDAKSLKIFNDSQTKVELAFQWVQQLVVDADHRCVFSVSAPILSRCFQELANGMVEYRQASKIARIPLPFPYVQATELLLVSHWILAPFLMALWTGSAMWSFLLCFFQVTFYWSLNSIATELENPFGEDVNDLPAAEIQQDFNERLLLLVSQSTRTTPRLSSQAHKELLEHTNPRKATLTKTGKLHAGGIRVNTASSDTRINREASRKSLGDLYRSVREQVINPDDASEEGVLNFPEMFRHATPKSTQDISVPMQSVALHNSRALTGSMKSGSMRSEEGSWESTPRSPAARRRSMTSDEEEREIRAVDDFEACVHMPPGRMSSFTGAAFLESGKLVDICEDIRDQLRQYSGSVAPSLREILDGFKDVRTELKAVVQVREEFRAINRLVAHAASDPLSEAKRTLHVHHVDLPTCMGVSKHQHSNPWLKR